jgi:hypothetical protein
VRKVLICSDNEKLPISCKGSKAEMRLYLLPKSTLMKSYVRILLVVFSALSNADFADKIGTHAYHYDLLSEAVDVGDITIKIVGQADGSYVIAESTSIKAEGWWGDISRLSTKIENYSPEGNFLKADIKILTGKKAFWRKAELAGGELWAAYTEVENMSEKDEAELVGVGVTVASGLVAGLGNVIAVTQLLLADNDAPLDSVRIAANTYDSSFANLPFYWTSSGYSLPAELSLFDSGTLSVNALQVEYLGTETFQQGAEQSVVVASHFKLFAENGSELEVWLAVSDKNSPYFYQLAGTDDDGPFQILLVQK